MYSATSSVVSSRPRRNINANVTRTWARILRNKLCPYLTLVAIISFVLFTIVFKSNGNRNEVLNFPAVQDQYPIQNPQKIVTVAEVDFSDKDEGGEVDNKQRSSAMRVQTRHPWKKNPKFKGCYSSIGSLEANVSHEVGDLDFYTPFEPTPGWIQPIEYEWKSDQAYPYQLEMLLHARKEHELESEIEKQAKILHKQKDSPITVELEPCNGKQPTKLMGLNMSKAPDFIDEIVDFDDIVLKNLEVNVGGEWTPIPAGNDESLSPKCPKVAIIIPYRDRLSHLKILLNVLHPMLQKQEIRYQIFVAEQFGQNKFSRGMISNAAFISVMKLGKFNCIIFQDVDLVPENDLNFYNCDSSPKHFAVLIDKFNYKMIYARHFGGVIGMIPEHFLLINGYPNTYWGWGGEDDDLYYRTEVMHLNISRYSSANGIARYTMLGHSDEKKRASEFTCELLRTARTRFPFDGISTMHFRLLSIVYEELYTHLLIDVGLPDKIHYEDG